MSGSLSVMTEHVGAQLFASDRAFGGALDQYRLLRGDLRATVDPLPDQPLGDAHTASELGLRQVMPGEVLSDHCARLGGLVPLVNRRLVEWRGDLTQAFEVPKKANRKTAAPPHVAKEAAALKRLWLARPKDRRLSQEKFGQEYGLGTQGNVWQYLNGWLELDATTAERFARGLGCVVSDFSPRLADEIKQLGRRATTTPPTRILRHPVSDRGMDMAAEWEQLDDRLKMVYVAGAARVRGEPLPGAARLSRMIAPSPPGTLPREDRPHERDHAAE
jgi:hypothetical protein